MALTDATSVKLLAGWASITTYDARVTALLAPVSTFIAKWLGRVVEQTAGIVEYPMAYGTTEIRLHNPPVTFTGLTSIYYDPSANFGRGSNDFAATTLLTEGTDYALEVDQTDGVTSLGGIVRRIGGVWAGKRTRNIGKLAASMEPKRGHIKATYSGGWATVPGDIAAAANLLIIRIIMMGPRGLMLLNEAYAGYSYALNPPALWGNSLVSPEIACLLLPYRKMDV